MKTKSLLNRVSELKYRDIESSSLDLVGLRFVRAVIEKPLFYERRYELAETFQLNVIFHAFFFSDKERLASKSKLVVANTFSFVLKRSSGGTSYLDNVGALESMGMTKNAYLHASLPSISENSSDERLIEVSNQYYRLIGKLVNFVENNQGRVYFDDVREWATGFGRGADKWA